MPRQSLHGSNYPENWKKIAHRVKDAAGWHCIRCGHKHDPISGYVLTVHHMDMNPSNNAWWNLLALCQRCHLHIQAKVDVRRLWMFEHSEWIKPYVAGMYAAWNGHPDDRAFVMAHLDALLDYGRPNGGRMEFLDLPLVDRHIDMASQPVTLPTTSGFMKAD